MNNERLEGDERQLQWTRMRHSQIERQKRQNEIV